MIGAIAAIAAVRGIAAIAAIAAIAGYSSTNALLRSPTNTLMMNKKAKETSGTKN